MFAETEIRAGVSPRRNRSTHLGGAALGDRERCSTRDVERTTSADFVEFAERKSSPLKSGTATAQDLDEAGKHS